MLDLIERVFAGEVFKDHEALSQVFILILKLEDLCVLIVDKFRLLLDGFTQAQVPLQHLLHHVHGVNDPASDRVLRLVSRIICAALRGNSPGCPDTIRINTIDFIAVRSNASATTTNSVLLMLIGFLSHSRILSLQDFVIVASGSIMAAT